MTDGEFEELKRVCRIRGVAETTKKPAPMKVFLVSAEAVQRYLDKEGIKSGPPYGEGLPCPEGFMEALRGMYRITTDETA